MTPQPTAAELEKLQQLYDATTPGEWFRWTVSGDISADSHNGHMIFQHEGFIESTDENPTASCTPQANADCDFVIAAHTAFPRLIANVKRLEQELAQARKDGSS